ncbi:hypothetical protein N9O24_00410 [bacterium]|nr:hypothetical protein [bacterium]
MSAGIDSCGCIDAEIEFNKDLFDLATVERFAMCFKTLAAAVAEASGSVDVWKLQFHTLKERDTVLNDFNDTAFTFPGQCGLLAHDLVARQVLATPQVAAVE